MSGLEVIIIFLLFRIIPLILLFRDNVEMVELLNGLNFLFSSKVFMMSMMLPWIRFVKIKILAEVPGVVHRKLKTLE